MLNGLYFEPVSLLTSPKLKLTNLTYSFSEASHRYVLAKFLLNISE